jgi:hypothetical protein
VVKILSAVSLYFSDLEHLLKPNADHKFECKISDGPTQFSLAKNERRKKIILEFAK